MESCRIDRYIKPKDFGEIASGQLHNVCDANEIGYGVVTNLRLINTENEVHVSFLFGKAGVAPLNKLTIPRLELTSAMLAVRVERMLKTELQIPLTTAVFWTDNTFLLKYIKKRHKKIPDICGQPHWSHQGVN